MCRTFIHGVVVLFLVCSSWFPLHSCIREVQFLAGSPVCYDDIMTTSNGNQCVRRVVYTNSSSTGSRHDRRRCIQSCALDTRCVGVTVDKVEKDLCGLHYDDCPSDTAVKTNNCSEDQYHLHHPHRRFYSKNCAHDGRWAPSDNRCLCVDGWVGDRCQSLATDLKDFKAAGYPRGHVRGYLDLRSKGAGLVPVHSMIYPSTYTQILIMKQTGRVSFNRSWSEYRDGFFENEDNFWAGLEVWRAVSRAGYKNAFFVLNFKTMGQLYRKYLGFSITDAADNYRVSFDTSTRSGDGAILYDNYFGECLRRGTPFSTFDRDTDGIPDNNCAAIAGSGWWYWNYNNGGGGAPCVKACHLLGIPPAHRTVTTPPNQHLFVAGVSSQYMTKEEFVGITIYVSKGT